MRTSNPSIWKHILLSNYYGWQYWYWCEIGGNPAIIVFIIKSFISSFNFYTLCPFFYKYLNVDPKLLLWPTSSFFISKLLPEPNRLSYIQGYSYSTNSSSGEYNSDSSSPHLAPRTSALRSVSTLPYICTIGAGLPHPSKHIFEGRTSNRLLKTGFLYIFEQHIYDRLLDLQCSL